MAHICKTEAIVLKGMRYRESSRIVSLYTKKFGRVKVIAKGVRRPKSRFGSSLEPFTVSSIVFYRRENRELYNISEADIVKEHPRIRAELERMTPAYVMIDFLDVANPEESPNPRLYALTDSMLDHVETCEARLVELLLWAFLIRAAAILGYGPVFDHCVICRKKVTTGFSPALGGAVCSECSLGKGEVWRLGKDSLELMKRLSSGIPVDIGDMEPSDEQRNEISEILKFHLAYQTERNMRSFDFLKSLERARRAAVHSSSR